MPGNDQRGLLTCDDWPRLGDIAALGRDRHRFPVAEAHGFGMGRYGGHRHMLTRAAPATFAPCLLGVTEGGPRARYPVATLARMARHWPTGTPVARLRQRFPSASC